MLLLVWLSILHQDAQRETQELHGIGQSELSGTQDRHDDVQDAVGEMHAPHMAIARTLLGSRSSKWDCDRWDGSNS